MEPFLPFTPIRWTLYSKGELFGAFDGSDASSFGKTQDFAIYRHYVSEGRSNATSPFSSMMQALHDSSINGALRSLLAGRRVAGVMGGHRMPRDAKPYAEVARLSRRLTRAGMLVCSGGGPGAMEATHLGAALANSGERVLEKALERLASAPTLPDLSGMVRPDGSTDAALLEQAHAWFRPAWEVAIDLADPGESLSVPTWQYGHEPSSPLAFHIAKYFQNSIREDGLLAIATQGVVYTSGRAGTIQEIFQDAAQNYYQTYLHASPMVLLGVDLWTKTFPVAQVLRSLFGETFASLVLVTDDVAEAAAFLERFKP